MAQTSMRGPYTASFALHASVAAALAAGAVLTATVVTHQEQAFLQQVAKQEEAEKKQAEKDSANAAAEAAKTQVALSLTDLVAGHVAPPDSDMIIADAQQAVEDLFAQQQNGAADGETDPHLIEQAEKLALERALASTDQRLQQALVAQVRDHIRREVVPEITERVDRELKQGLGETLKQKVEQAVRDDKHERLSAIAKAVRAEAQALKESAAKDDVRQIREGATAAEERLREPLARAQAQDPLLDGKAKEAAADAALAERLAQANDADKARKAVDERAKALEQLAGALEQHANRSEEDGVQQRIAAKAEERLADPLAKTVRERIESQAVPAAAQKITEAVAKDLEKLGLPKERFQEAVTADIKTALQEELPATDASTAWMKTARAMNFRPTADLAETRAKIENAAEAMEKAAQDQQDARLDDAKAQRGRAVRVSELSTLARKALGEARDASLSADDRIEQGLDNLRTSKAEANALRAAEAMDKRLDEPAKQAAAETVKELQESAKKLRAVGEALAREESAKPSPPAASVRELVAQQDARGAEGSAKAVAAKVAEGLDAAAQQAVDKAAAQLKGEGVLVNDDRVAQLLALRANLAGALARSADPRAMGTSQLAEGFGASLAGGGRAGGRPGAGGGSPSRLRSGSGLWNRELYEKFVKDLRERTNPSAAQTAPTEPVGLDTTAEPATVAEPAVVYVPTTTAKEHEKDAKPAAPREPVKPTFTSPASGYAVWQEKPLTIDGDLADWGERTLPIRMQWNADNTKLDGGPELWLRWSNEGMYVAYAVQDPTGIQKCDAPWSGDCMEMWLDAENTRKEFMNQVPNSQQLVFMPFGCEKSPGTFCEIGRGQRGLGSHQQYYDVEGKRGAAAAKVVDGGYVVEAFVRKQALAYPVLLPGMWVAMNFSMNTGYQGRNGREMQWSASKGISTWDRPNTWGDILLLGADASVRVLSRPAEGEPAPIDHLVAGQSFTVEISDADLNLDPARTDRIACTVQVPGRDEPTLAVLKETGVNSGVFRASLATRSREDDPAPNAVRVRPGEIIKVTYQDVRGGFGETDRTVTAELPVAIPVLRFGAK